MKKYQLFTAEEEKELFRKLREEGCMESRRLLIESVLALAKKLVAKHYFRDSNRGEHEELLSCATMACIKAVDRFDTARGVRLSTTVGYSLQGECDRRFLGGFVHIPSYLPWDDPVRAKFNAWVSLDKSVSMDGESMELGFAIDPHDHVQDIVDSEEKRRNGQRVRKALDKLPERQRQILIRRFYDGKTLEECAPEFGVTRERVRQIEALSLKFLKAALETPEEEKEMSYDENPQPTGDIMQAIEALTSVQLDQRINALEAECARVTQGLIEKIKKLRALRKAMFGGEASKSSSDRRGVRAVGGLPAEGSVSAKAIAFIKANGGRAMLHDIARGIEATPQQLAPALRISKQFFKKNEDASWSLVS